jgi:multidrug efflux pump subunit AcrA (membrane-fusion protein)
MSPLANSSAAPAPQRASLQAVRPPGPSRRRWTVAIVLIAALAGAAWFLRPKPRGDRSAAAAVKTVKAVRGVLQRTLRVTGSVTARHFSNIVVPLAQAPETRELVLISLASNGAPIKEGGLIAQIETQAVRDHLDDVEAQVRQVELDMRRLRANQQSRREAMEQQIRVAKATWDKAAEDMKAAAVRSEIQREQMRLLLEEAEVNYKQMQSELGFLDERQAAEWRIAEIGQQGQIRHKNRHLVDLERFSIRSPRSGQVILRTINNRNGEQNQIRVGDEVGPGMAIAKVVDVSSMQVEAMINQTESEMVRLGQKAVIRFDAYPGLELDGKVESVGMMVIPGRRVNYFVRRVPVRIAIDGADPRVLPDLTASADVVLEEDDEALLIPREAVQESGGKSVVLVKQGEAIVSREVEIGGYSNTQVSVVSGLQEGDQVAIQPTEKN